MANARDPNDRTDPSDPARPATPADAGADSVTLVDAFGRPVRVPRAQWRKEVLPQMVQAYAHAPDKLAAMIVQHLQQGLAADLLPAALRLAAVDPEPERALAVLAAVQRAGGDLDGAERTLLELRQRRPDSAQARVGMAVVLDARGRRDEATALVFEVLQRDGNHGDALHQWLAFERARLGDDRFHEALDAACELPDSWRPQLFRAAWRHDRGDRAGAETDLRAVAARRGDLPDALMMLAQDLLRTQRADLIEELVVPRYRLEQHHPVVGLAVLQHHQHKREPEAGLELLHQLRVRFQRAIDAQLAPFDAAFTRMLTPPPQPKLDGPPRVVLYRMDRPVWFGPLGGPEYVLPRRPDGARQLVIAALAVHNDQAAQQVTREDEVGRLSRSLPLFLQDQLMLLAGQPTAVALPVADVGGWVVAGTPWPEARLVELLPDRERGTALVLSGQVRTEGQRRTVELWLYDAATAQRAATLRASGEDGKLGPVLLQLLADLGPLLGRDPLRPALGSEVFWDRYAAGLGQLAALVVAHQGALPKDRVYGHRAILEWLLAVALEERRSVQARLLLAAGLCADAAIGSRVHRELAAPFAELFRVEPANSAFAQLARPALKLLGLETMWQHRQAEILAAAGDGARSFLQRDPGAGSSRG